MLYPEFRWIEVAVGGASRRGQLVEIGAFRVPKGAKDAYRTVFRYPDAMREHVRQRGSVAGYHGPLYADWVPIDIDSSDLGEAHDAARSVLNQLLHRYEVNLAEVPCFFSGAKGFHILLPAEMLGLEPATDMPVALKRMVPALFDGVRIDTTIYDAVRLFRLTNTINSKTGLYKIPLTAAEVLHQTTSEILELAKSPRRVEFPHEFVLNGALAELYREALAAVRSSATPVPAGQARRRESAKGQKPCIVRILEGVSEGSRDNAAIRLAVHLAKQGMPEDVVLSALKAWNMRNVPPLSESEVAKSVESAFSHDYDFGCNDAVLEAFCDGQCPFKGRETEAPPTDRVYDVRGAYEAYLRYIQQLRKAKVTLGLGKLDEKMRGVAPGEVCQIIARSGVGKTALVLNILRHAVRAGSVPALFFTMEMPLAQVYERMAQIANRVPGWQVEQETLRSVVAEQGRAEELAGTVFTEFGGLYFVEDDGLDLEQVRRFCETATDLVGQPIRLVAIDYMGRMNGGPGSVYEVTSRVAKGIKWLAKELNVAVVSLHQLSRAGGDGTVPVTIEMARDSGVIEEAADFVLGLWRPEMRESVSKDEEPIRIALLKNRKGALAQCELVFEKPYLRVREDSLDAILGAPWPGGGGTAEEVIGG